MSSEASASMLAILIVSTALLKEDRASASVGGGGRKGRTEDSASESLQVCGTLRKHSAYSKRHTFGVARYKEQIRTRRR